MQTVNQNNELERELKLMLKLWLKLTSLGESSRRVKVDEVVTRRRTNQFRWDFFCSIANQILNEIEEEI